AASFPGGRDAAVRALRAYQAFLTADAAVRERVSAGDRDGALALALGSQPGQLGAAFANLDGALGQAIDIDQREFDSAIVNAMPALGIELAVAPCALAIVLPAPGAFPAGSDMPTITDRGKVTAGVAQASLLFGYLNPVSNELEGFDIDLVKQVSRALFGDDRHIEWHVITTPQRIPQLQS